MFLEMISRRATQKLLQLASQFKAVAVIGPRRSGKTTLVKALFPGKPYLSLEDPDIWWRPTAETKQWRYNRRMDTPSGGWFSWIKKGSAVLIL
jgi:predicted AAA+ superfamily ATPase